MKAYSTHQGKPIQRAPLPEDVMKRVRPNDVVYVKDGCKVTRIEHVDGTVETLPEERV